MLKRSCEFYQFQMSRAWVLVLELDSAVFMHAHIRHSHHLQPVCDSRKRGCSLRTFGSKQTTINKWIVIFFRFVKSEILHRFVRRGIKPETVLITLSFVVRFFRMIQLFYFTTASNSIYVIFFIMWNNIAVKVKRNASVSWISFSLLYDVRYWCCDCDTALRCWISEILIIILFLYTPNINLIIEIQVKSHCDSSGSWMKINGTAHVCLWSKIKSNKRN